VYGVPEISSVSTERQPTPSARRFLNGFALTTHLRTSQPDRKAIVLKYPGLATLQFDHAGWARPAGLVFSRLKKDDRPRP
jgi:hypothetical protein